MPRNPVNDIRAAGALRSKASTTAGPADEFQSRTTINPAGIIEQVGNNGTAKFRIYGDGSEWMPIQSAVPGTLTDGQFFIVTVSGVDYWAYVDSTGTVRYASGPAGSNTQVQFNDNGMFGGDSGFTYDKTADQVTLTQAGSTQLKLSRITSTTGIVTLGAIGDRNGANTYDALQVTNNAGTGSVAIRLLDTGNANVVGGGFITQLNLGLSTSVPVGSAAAPSLAFAGDLDTGLYNVGANDLGIATGGVLRLDVSTTAVTSTLIAILPASTTGAASERLPHGVAPTSPVNGDLWTTTTGLFVRINGVTVGPLANGTGTVTGTGTAGQVSYWTGTSAIAGNAGMVYDSVNNQLAVAAGTAALPSYAIVGNLNTGWYGSAANTFSIATNGVLRWSTSTTAVTSTLPIVHAVGAVGAPAVTFTGDTTTGFYHVAANDVGLATNGILRWDVSATAVTSTLINVLPASTTAAASTRIPHGSAPTSPVDGDEWTTTAGLFVRINGVTVGPLSSNTGTVTGTGTAGQVSYWTGTSVLAGDAGMVYDATNDQLALSADTAALPSYSFIGDLDTGIYHVGANDLGFSAGGVLAMDISTTAVTVALASLLSSASTFTIAATTIDGSDTARVIIQGGGVGGTITRGSGVILNGNESASTGALTLFAGNVAGGIINFSTAATTWGTINVAGQLSMSAGTAAAPAYTIIGDVDTGIYSVGANDLGFATNGILRLDISAVAVTSALPLTIDLGTGALPTTVGSSAVVTVMAQIDSTPCRQEYFGFGTTAWNVRGRSSGGTRAALTATPDLTAFIFLTGNGYEGAAWADGGTFSGRADGLWSVSNHGSFWRWTGIPNGSTTAATWMELKGAALSVTAGGLTTAGDITATAATARLLLSRTNSANASYAEYKDSNAVKFNWIAGAQFNVDNGFEITPSTIAGGTTYSTPALKISSVGVVTISSALALGAGSAGAPSLTFVSNTTAGIYQVGTNDVGVATNGILRWDVSTTAITSTLPLFAPAGAVGTPAFSFSGDTNTGIYSVGADDIGISTGGTLRFDLSTTQITSTLKMVMTGATATGVTVTGATDATFGHTGAFSLHIETNGIDAITIDQNRICTFSQQILAATGGASAPGHSFTSSTGAGMYLIGADHIGFSTGSSLRLDMSTALVTSALPITITGNSTNQSSILTIVNNSAGAYGTLFSEGAGGDGVTNWAKSFVIEAIPASGGNLVLSAYTGSVVFQSNLRTTNAYFNNAGQWLVPGGTAAAPAYSIVANSNAGIYQVGSDNIGISTAGVLRFSVSTSTVAFADAINLVVGTTTGTQIGTAASQKLGFFGATAIIQPATTGTATGFTAGGGTTVTDSSTFTGGTGATAYRISDIVKALKTLGLMAA